jgi:hypothetical protein
MVLLLAVLVAVFAAPAGASSGKTTICHGTASAKNPYVVITVSNNARDGHLGTDGSPPGHGQNNNEDREGDDCANGEGGGYGEE